MIALIAWLCAKVATFIFGFDSVYTELLVRYLILLSLMYYSLFYGILRKIENFMKSYQYYLIPDAIQDPRFGKYMFQQTGFAIPGLFFAPFILFWVIVHGGDTSLSSFHFSTF